MSNSDLKLYSATEVESARTKGQVIGILQGAGAVFLFGMLLNLLGWVPLIVVGVVGVIVVMKLFSK